MLWMVKMIYVNNISKRLLRQIGKVAQKSQKV
jgi:hypothetical protein